MSLFCPLEILIREGKYDSSFNLVLSGSSETVAHHIKQAPSMTYPFDSDTRKPLEYLLPEEMAPQLISQDFYLSR